MTASSPAAFNPAGLRQVSESVGSEAVRYRDAFLHAEPFKHVVIENFFEPSFARRLLEEFPSFDTKLAMNEHGSIGGKAVNTRIREISPAYQELYEAISSQPFLDLIGRLSGIPDLILDPKLYGGGTHDNRHGQDLDPHVDFNYDEAQQLHRRLNLIVYLNEDWKTEWGGAIEIHSNPRDPASNRIRAYDPLFNRCVMFETNEYSWHGFPRINLPPDKRHLSRKSISIYLYTKDRPAEEIAPLHRTFYVQRPLPDHIQAGRALTGEDVEELRKLLVRRDDWIAYYHKMELDKNREIAAKDHAVQDLMNRVHAPLTGYVLQAGPAAGIYADGWVASHAELPIQPLAPVSSLLLRGWRPENAPSGRIRISAGSRSAEAAVAGGSFEIPLSLPQAAAETFTLKIDSKSQGRVVDSTVDSRDLEFLVSEIRARHPLLNTLTKLLG
jgi:2-oxoglutarate-Fe(II)-dependent oxygenase superfamily protein